MNTPFQKLTLLTLAVFSGISVAYSAPVLVIGNPPYAKACFDAASDFAADAVAGQPDVGVGRRVQGPSGSNLTIDGFEACTLSLAEEDLSRHDRAGTYNNRGAMYFARNAFKEALRDFDNGITFDNEIAALHANRGATLMALGRWPEGVTALDQALKLIAASSSAPTPAAQKTPTGTEVAASIVEEMNPAKVYYNRAMALEKMGEIRRAYFDYLKASELLPEWDLPRSELARFTVRRKPQ